jgi:IclR family acetate operon transcriptional repressor
MANSDDASRSGQVQSLTRALRALQALSGERNGLTLTALAAAVKLPRSTTHRLLTTMSALQFVMFDPKTNQWRIGPQAFAVGAAFGDVRDFAQVGRPYLRALNMASRETVSISVPDQHDQVFVAQARGMAQARGLVQSGDRLPIHFTASGKSIMAFWRDNELETHFRTADFTRRTAQSNNNVVLLAEKLAAIKARGFAYDCEETHGDLRCVAAPVFDALGEPVAALSISAPMVRMDKPRMHDLGCELRAAALKMTTALGGRAPAALSA